MPAKRKGHSMTQRILFHPAPTVEWLKGLQVENLGKIPKGTWLAAEDAAALELVKRDKATLALYPSREAYAEAVEGLSGTEIAEAVELRRAIVEGNPQTRSVPDFYFLEREGLTAIAVAEAESGKDLDAAFRAQVQVLAQLNGPDSYKGQDKLSLLDGLFDDLNKLNWEEEALRRHPGVTLVPLDPALEKSRKDLALELKRAERSLGVKYDHEPTGRVLDRLERGIFARPLDENLVRGIAEGHEPVQKWKDGFVSVWGEYALQNIPMADKEKTILYFDGGHCRGDFMSSTKGQLLRRFERQSRIPKSDDAAAYLAQLRLAVAIECLGRQGLVAGFNPALGDRIGRHAALEASHLKSFLAASKPWRKTGAKTGLRAELQATLRETDFWRALAAAKHWDFEQERMDWIATAKAKVLSHLPQGM